MIYRSKRFYNYSTYKSISQYINLPRKEVRYGRKSIKIKRKDGLEDFA